MLAERIDKALRLVAEEERRSRYAPTLEKIAAIREAASMFTKKGSLLDIGGCEYSVGTLIEIGFHATMTNIHEGHEMHDITGGDFDCVFMRHTLEHSPFPLYMLLTVHECLKDGGEAVVVVPEPKGDWVMTHDAHVSVLHKETWEKLFRMAGFSITKQEDGTWTKTGETEWRYLLKKT
jgi:hypothetical protein